MLEDSGGGITVPPGDAQAMAAAILELHGFARTARRTRQGRPPLHRGALLASRHRENARAAARRAHGRAQRHRLTAREARLRDLEPPARASRGIRAPGDRGARAARPRGVARADVPARRAPPRGRPPAPRPHRERTALLRGDRRRSGAPASRRARARAVAARTDGGDAAPSGGQEPRRVSEGPLARSADPRARRRARARPLGRRERDPGDDRGRARRGSVEPHGAPLGHSRGEPAAHESSLRLLRTGDQRGRSRASCATASGSQAGARGCSGWASTFRRRGPLCATGRR